VGYPARLLADGEEVLVDTHPHWWYLAGPVAASATMVVAAVVVYVRRLPLAADWAALAILAVAIAWLLGRYARWSTRSLVVTTDRVVDRRGLVGRSGREVALAHVTDISYHQSLWGRLVGIGDLVVESPARGGQEVFSDLPHPEAIRAEIYRAINRQRRHDGSRGLSVAEQLERLEELRRRGALSQQEFEKGKAQLLDRR
jgi:uncharacterized membrane protein YdbT with pleckstrin-like domain